MVPIILSMIMVFVSLAAEELKVTADLFESDEKKGVTLFKGNVVIHKGQDRLSAQSVEIFTDAKRKPTKFIAIGDVDFVINAKNSNTYKGTSDKAVFLPQAKEYYFYNNVYLTQEGTDNTIKGNTIIVNLTKGTAMAQGDSSKPVTMTFQINDEDNND